MMSKMKRLLEDIQEAVINEIELFNERNLFNEYYKEDYKDFIKDLEHKYNVEIDPLTYEVK